MIFAVVSPVYVYLSLTMTSRHSRNLLKRKKTPKIFSEESLELDGFMRERYFDKCENGESFIKIL